MFEFSEEYLKRVLEDIFSGKITRYTLPVSLYYAIANYLKKGVYEGFNTPSSLNGAKDVELLAELNENIYMFSAAKTYQQVREMTDLLYSGDTVRSFPEFKKEAMKVYEQYNVDWLGAEYTTAIGQAQMASKWSEIARNVKALPLLKYDTIGDACSICAPLNGTVKPVNDPFWSKYYPLNHFNCFCVVHQLSEGEETTVPEDVLSAIDEKMNAVFKGNSGMDRVIFNEEHSYFTNVPKEDRGFAKNNFDLPIPDNLN